MEVRKTYVFERIVACVLHVRRARVVDLDLFPLCGARGDEQVGDRRCARARAGPVVLGVVCGICCACAGGGFASSCGHGDVDAEGRVRVRACAGVAKKPGSVVSCAVRGVRSTSLGSVWVCTRASSGDFGRGCVEDEEVGGQAA